MQNKKRDSRIGQKQKSNKKYHLYKRMRKKRLLKTEAYRIMYGRFHPA